jgi:hypothetical protein
VMTLDLSQPTPGFLIEPATTGRLVAAFRGGWDTIATGDAEFDRVFRASSPNAEWLRQLLTSSLRHELLRVHGMAGGTMTPGAAANMSKALLFGSFEAVDTGVSYSVMGTPHPNTITALQQGKPTLVTIARACSA